MNAPLPELPTGHDPHSLRLVLEAQGWDIRSSARVLGIPYRRLAILRRAYALYATSRRATSTTDDPMVLPTPSVASEPARAQPDLVLSLPPLAADLISVPDWGKQSGYSSESLRAMRQTGRIAPLYTFGEPPQVLYYTTVQATVLPSGQKQATTALKGYVTLHQLEQQHGALREKARLLHEAGQIRLIGHHPTLIGDHDVSRLLSESPPELSSTPLSALLGPQHPARTRLTPPVARPFAPTPPPRIPAPKATLRPINPQVNASSAPPAGPTDLPYISQVAWVQLPRFEAQWSDSELVISDRGAGGEHIFDPQPQARFINAALAHSIFPVLQTRPPCAPSTLLDPEPPLIEADTPSPYALGAHEDQLPEVAVNTLSDNLTLQVQAGLSATEVLSAVEVQETRSLQATLQQTRQQLEQAQVDLALLRERPLPELKRGYSRLPDRRVRQLETALSERDLLNARVTTLEGELQGLLADVGALARPQARASHLAHVRDRLRERFGVDYSEAQVEALDRQVLSLPTTGVTKKGRVFKKVQIAGHEIYTLVVRDDGGVECIGTVYTHEMYQRAQHRTPSASRSAQSR